MHRIQQLSHTPGDLVIDILKMRGKLIQRHIDLTKHKFNETVRMSILVALSNRSVVFILKPLNLALDRQILENVIPL